MRWLTEELRHRANGDTSFQRWRAELPKVLVDDEHFMVIHGDRLANEEEVLLEWIDLFHPEWFRS